MLNIWVRSRDRQMNEFGEECLGISVWSVWLGIDGYWVGVHYKIDEEGCVKPTFDFSSPFNIHRIFERLLHYNLNWISSNNLPNKKHAKFDLICKKIISNIKYRNRFPEDRPINHFQTTKKVCNIVKSIAFWKSLKVNRLYNL